MTCATCTRTRWDASHTTTAGKEQIYWIHWKHILNAQVILPKLPANCLCTAIRSSSAYSVCNRCVILTCRSAATGSRSRWLSKLTSCAQTPHNFTVKLLPPHFLQVLHLPLLQWW